MKLCYNIIILGSRVKYESLQIFIHIFLSTKYEKVDILKLWDNQKSGYFLMTKWIFLSWVDIVEFRYDSVRYDMDHMFEMKSGYFEPRTS